MEKEVVETVNPTVDLKQEKVSKKPQVERPAREKNTKNTHKKEERQDIVKAEVKEKTGKEKTVKEKIVKEKPVKEKPVKEKTAKQTEILTNPEEIKEIEGRAKKFLDEVFAAMSLDVEIKIVYNKEDAVSKRNFLAMIWESLSAKEDRHWILFNI